MKRNSKAKVAQPEKKETIMETKSLPKKLITIAELEARLSELKWSRYLGKALIASLGATFLFISSRLSREANEGFDAKVNCLKTVAYSEDLDGKKPLYRGMEDGNLRNLDGTIYPEEKSYYRKNANSLTYGTANDLSLQKAQTFMSGGFACLGYYVAIFLSL